MGDKSKSTADVGLTGKTRSGKVTLEDIFNRLVANESSVNNRLEKIESSQKTLLSQVCDKLKEIKVAQKQFADQSAALKQELNTVKKRCVSSDHRVSSLAKTVDDLRSQVESLQNEKLRTNIRLTGFPNGNHNIQKAIINIGEALGQPITANDIENIKSFSSKKGQQAIVTFVSKETAENFINGRKGKSIYSDEIGFSDLGRRQLYIHEDLTKFAQELLFNARQLKTDNCFKFVWSKKGQIYARRSETSKAVRLTNVQQVAELKKKAQADEEGEPSEDDRAVGDDDAAETEDEEIIVDLDQTVREQLRWL